jgi:ribosomal protein S17
MGKPHTGFAEDKCNNGQEKIRKDCYNCQRIRQGRRREENRKGSEKRASLWRNLQEQCHRAARRPHEEDKTSSYQDGFREQLYRGLNHSKTKWKLKSARFRKTIFVKNKMERKQKTKVEARKHEAPKKSQENKAIVNTKIEKHVGTRGRLFEGIVTKKFPRRIVLEFERMIYVRKYERYARLKTKIHARLPDSMEKIINVGDLIRVHECRPLSKIIHFVVVQKIKDASEVNK